MSKRMIKKISFFLFTILLFSQCQQAVDLENFDEDTFQADPQGCKGERIKMRDQVLRLPQQLEDFTQQEIQATLGKADRQELSNRSQKYLIYFIEPAPACSENATEKAPLTMYVRFNSVGRANEISFQNY